jgi:Protein of unknown function (DUF2975)
MKPKTKWMLGAMQFIAWIIFIGLCIKTGAMMFSFFISLAKNPEATKNLYESLDLSDLYQYSIGQYVVFVSIIIVLSASKAHLFYLIIRIFSKINLIHPFSKAVSSLISTIGYVALGIGIVTVLTFSYRDWLANQGVSFPDLQAYLGGGAEYLLLGGIIFMISEVFKRGIEIQTENELTV